MEAPCYLSFIMLSLQKCLRSLVFLTLLSGAEAAKVAADHTTVELVAAADAIVPGQAFELAIHFDLEEDWHIYWKNPGASGLAPDPQWNLPEGVEAGSFQWPAPERIELGGLINYGYEGEAIFIIEMQASENLVPGDRLNIGVDLFWLICKEICLPGDAQLEISLPVSESASSAGHAALFDRGRRAQPNTQSPWSGAAYTEEDTLVLVLEGASIPEDLYFYAGQSGQLNPNAKQILSFKSSDSAELRIPMDAPFLESRPGSIEGVMQSSGGSWKFEAEISDGAPRVAPEPGNLGPVGFEQRLLALGMPGILSLAFLGGLILNIMPCVLPVLSLKVFSLLKHSGQSRSEAFKHGFAYTVGVVLSFIALAGVLFALRAFGERIGWGFQLQSPGFVVVLTAVFFLFGLNLMGVFELGSRLVGADASVAKRNDLIGSFGMGVLAAVVGAPCMGPLVAGVGGLAVQANVATGILIFATMGLGLASPFLVLSIFPKLVAFLPKPGAWMESFKQAMGFLLMAAVIFLLFVAGRQGGVDAMLFLLIVILFCALAAWIFGRWGAASRSRKSQRIARVLSLVLLAYGLYLGIQKTEAAYGSAASAATNGDRSGQWQAWSEARVEAALDEGRPVFVDFTATWCLICQVNKKVALRTESTEALFDQYDVLALEADWTRYDPAITDALETFDRSGVPLYLFYTPDGDVSVLPQNLTNGVVREAVENALGPKDSSSPGD